MKGNPPQARTGQKDPAYHLLIRQASEEATGRLRRLLPSTLYSVDVVGCASEATAILHRGGIEVVLLDLSTPSMESRLTFEAVGRLAAPPPIIVYGPKASMSTLTQFVRHGAYSLFALDDEPDVILAAIRQAARTYRLTLENAGLRETLARKKRTVDILERLGEAMSSMFDPQRVLGLTVRVIRRALDCEACGIYLVDPLSGELVEPRDLGVAGGHPQLELWNQPGSDPRGFLRLAAETCLADAKPLDLAGSRTITEAIKASDVPPSARPLRSLIAFPMAAGRRTLGVMVAANRIGAERFSAQDTEILSSVARQTGLAMAGTLSVKKEHSLQEKLAQQVAIATGRLRERNLELSRRLHEKEEANRKIHGMAAEIAEKNRSLEEMVKHFRVIHEVSQAIGSELENEALIKRIITETAALLGAETVSIMLRNGDGCLRIRHAEGLSADVIMNTRVRPGEGISGWVAAEGKPMLVRDVSGMRRAAPERTIYRTDSLLCVPLKIKGQITGVLNVTNRKSGGAFDDRDLSLLTILGNHAAVAIENARLYNALRDSYFKTIKALVNAVEAKDTWTKDHSENVTNYSLKIADYLGLSDRQKDVIRYAGVLHDIGKIVISNTITDKPDRLTIEEWERIKEHPLIGQRILDPIDYLEPVKICIQTHHERCDGSGYPFGLRAHEITLETRIISVADAFDAMVHSRPYRSALTLTQAVDELKRSSGTQFDAAVVNGLLRIIQAEGESGKAAWPEILN